MNVISNVWNGRAGLAKTYWLWGVLSGIPWGLVLSIVKPGSNLAIFAVLAFVTYYVVVHISIWRAASQYQGSKIWTTLAKVAVAITPACLVIGTLAAVIIPATHQLFRKELQTTSATQPWGVNDKPVSNSGGWGANDKPVPRDTLPELDCKETGEPAIVVNGREFTPVKCK